MMWLQEFVAVYGRRIMSLNAWVMIPCGIDALARGHVLQAVYALVFGSFCFVAAHTPDEMD